MNHAPDFRKSCARCPAIVTLTPEQWQLERDQLQTTCPVCRAKLAIEAADVLERAARPLSQAEAQTSPHPSTT